MGVKKHYCFDCIYSGHLYHDIICEYIFRKGKMRPCPPGKDCTVKITRKKGNKRGKADGQ